MGIIPRGINLPALEDLLAVLGAEGYELPSLSTYSMEEGASFVESINNLYTFREKNRDKINKLITEQFGQSGRTLIPVTAISSFIKKLCEVDLSLKFRCSKESEELLTEIPEFDRRVLKFADSYFLKILHLSSIVLTRLRAVPDPGSGGCG